MIHLWSLLLALAALQTAPPRAPEPPPPDHPMTFFSFQDGNARYGNYLIAEGTITPETPRLFERRMREMEFSSSITWMMLNSSGGDVLAALELGRLIRRENLRTQVGSMTCLEQGVARDRCSTLSGEFFDGRCESACAYAFLGGIERKLGLLDFPEQREEYLTQNTRLLGFHQFYSAMPAIADGRAGAAAALDVLNSAQAQYTSSEIARYIEEMGVSMALLQQASNAGPDAMIFPNRADLIRLRVLYDQQYLDFRLQPDGAGISAVSPFSSGGSWTRQVAFYCGGADGLPQTPRLVFSRARFGEGRRWLVAGEAAAPTALSAVAALRSKRGDEEPAESEDRERSTAELQQLPPQEVVWGATLTAGAVRDGIRGEALRVMTDANWTHIVMWPNREFLQALQTAPGFTLHFDAANVYELMHDPVIALDEGERRSIAAAIRSCAVQ